ncbi:MAG TPA: hypothetical protein DCX67_02330 [Opitutae bacterium]|nr:hypothetical protein [Opitutae bacterium]
MFHPGGFGNSDYAHRKHSVRDEGSVLKPVLFLVALLFGWSLCFATGLWLGFGWYAWPLGSVVLISAFISISIVRASRRVSSTKRF